MYKELIGKMELHVSHDLSMRTNMEREYTIKDYMAGVQRSHHSVDYRQ
ncbi:MAG: hypothetical protein N2316_10070 [Spirochaetes bacterium]|nr:hypothetical protein [Spirochaetota bacterium]